MVMTGCLSLWSLSPCSPTLLQQVVCLSVDGLRQSFGVAMTVSANWWLEYSGRNNHLSPHGAAVSIFSFADRRIFSIAPITEVLHPFIHSLKRNPVIIFFRIFQIFKDPSNLISLNMICLNIFSFWSSILRLTRSSTQPYWPTSRCHFLSLCWP